MEAHADHPPPLSTPLPVVQTFREAASALYQRRGALTRAVALPIALIFGAAALSVFWEERADAPAAGQLLVAALGWVLPVLIAVSCHRLVLLGTESLPNRFGIFWSWREVRFFGWGVGLTLSTLLCAILVFFLVLYGLEVATPLELFGSDGTIPRSVAFAILPVALLAALYPIARLSLILPATAIDRPTGPRAAWRLSRSNGWRLALLTALPALLAAPWLLDPLAFGSAVLEVAWIVVTVPLTLLALVLPIAVLSKAFGRLAGVTPE